MIPTGSVGRSPDPGQNSPSTVHVNVAADLQDLGGSHRHLQTSGFQDPMIAATIGRVRRSIMLLRYAI
jgi:hypothetical protein